MRMVTEFDSTTRPRQITTKAEFVGFWSGEYYDELESLYDDSINRPLTEENIWALFKWKNGSEGISERKKEAIRSTYLSQLSDLPQIPDIPSGKRYIAHLAGGPIWDIFWVHCLSPGLFPIFDQHTYRAMAKIDGLPHLEIPASREKKIQIYFDSFIPFIQRLGGASRSLDKALFSYGRFLKNGYSKK
jgi:hypothetical protein